MNFAQGLINPLDGQAVSKFYEKGETYDSKFTSLGSSYEECRAECVGLYLSVDDDVLNIFNIVSQICMQLFTKIVLFGNISQDPQEKQDVIYTNWFSLCHAAINGVAMYSPASGEWKQAHSQARFVILQVLQEAGENFVSVKEVVGEDGKPDLLLTMVLIENDFINCFKSRRLLLTISGPKQISVCWQTSNWRIFEQAPNLQVDW